MTDSETAHKRRVSRLADLERESTRTIQDVRATKLKRSHEGQHEGNRSRISTHVRAGAYLGEVQAGRWRLVGIKRGMFQIVSRVRDVAAVERREQRFLPFRMFVEDNEVDGH